MPQLLALLSSSNRQSAQPENNVPFERSERKSEKAFNCNLRCRSRYELPLCSNFDDDCENAQYNNPPTELGVSTTEVITPNQGSETLVISDIFLGSSGENNKGSQLIEPMQTMNSQLPRMKQIEHIEHLNH